MVLSADGRTAGLQRHDSITEWTGCRIKQRIKGMVFQVFHGGDNGAGPVFENPPRRQASGQGSGKSPA